jgi:hypothetical protein
METIFNRYPFGRSEIDKRNSSFYFNLVVHENIITFKMKCTVWARVMIFNAIFNNISTIWWRSVLLVEETGVPGENHRPAASH